MKAEIDLKSGLVFLIPEKPIDVKHALFLFEHKHLVLTRSSLSMVGNDVTQLTFKINNGQLPTSKGCGLIGEKS